MEINPEALIGRSMYKIMTGAIVPRPIAWVSTVDVNGVPNLAPYSFFNAVGANPAHLLFCVSYREPSLKDTLANIIATEEFVVNIVTAQTVEAMVLTSGEYEPDVDEFALAGLTTTPSQTVKAPRVAESPIHFECKLAQIVQPGGETGGSIVIGRIVHVHVDESVLIGEDKIDIEKLRPVGRLAGAAYSHVNDIFEIERPS